MDDAAKVLLAGHRAEVQKARVTALEQIALWSLKLEDAEDLIKKYDVKLNPQTPQVEEKK